MKCCLLRFTKVRSSKWQVHKCPVFSRWPWHNESNFCKNLFGTDRFNSSNAMKLLPAIYRGKDRENNYVWGLSILCVASLPTAYVVQRKGYVLTRVCLSVQTGVPRSGPDKGGYPSQVQMRRVPQPSPDRGVPRSGPDRGILSGPGRGTPQQGWGTPQYRIADGVLDTPRSVCVLRSRRRTVLLKHKNQNASPKNDGRK